MSNCVKFRFHGHSCFSAEWRGVTIVFDPHDGLSVGGWPRPEVKGDLILVTHDHFDHNAVDVVRKDDSIVIKSFEGKKELVVKGEKILLEGYSVPHDRLRGVRRGFTSIYRVWLDNIILVHMGDIGTRPSDALFERLSKPRPDILMIPVGGNFTIEPFEAWEFTERINPVLVAPMHFWIPKIKIPLAPLSEFLLSAKTGKIEVEGGIDYCKSGENPEEKVKILVIKLPKIKYY